MSADVSNSGDESPPHAAADGFDVPPGAGSVTADGQRYRVTWHPASGTTKTALFRVVTDDRVAVLQHVRTVVLSQRGDTTATVDADARLDDVPRPLRQLMHADGFEPREVTA
jgi:hypothetical protein